MHFPFNDQPAPPSDQSLAEAYRNARYTINGFSLRIGGHHPDFDRWLSEHEHRTYLLLTAHNPASRLLPAAENRLRERALHDEVARAGLPSVPGWGADPHGTWPREDGRCLLDVPRATADALARKYGQNAVLEGEVRGVPHLRWVR